MSARRPAAVDAPAASDRLSSVLRAGLEQAQRKRIEFKPTLSPRAAPTGACVPRQIDADYCAWDRYYGIGVAVTSSFLMALLASPLTNMSLKAALGAMSMTLSKVCKIDSLSWSKWLLGDYAEFQGSNIERTQLCNLLSRMAQRMAVDLEKNTYARTPRNVAETPAFSTLIEANLLTILGYVLSNFDRVMDPSYAFTLAMVPPGQSVAFLYSLQRAIRAISYYNREISRGIASYLRVNARLMADEKPLLGPMQFAKMIQADIQDGLDAPPKRRPADPLINELKAVQRARQTDPRPVIEDMDASAAMERLFAEMPCGAALRAELKGAGMAM